MHISHLILIFYSAAFKDDSMVLASVAKDDSVHRVSVAAGDLPGAAVSSGGGREAKGPMGAQPGSRHGAVELSGCWAQGL